jgi:hypothetical protein
MLQALPNTALWHRLNKEGRLLEALEGDQMTLMNFTPTRPIEDIANEYIDAFCTLYDPVRYLDRTYRCFLIMGKPSWKGEAQMPDWIVIKALFTILWRQGIKRETRWKFWHHLFSILKHNPGVFERYLSTCAHIEHFQEYRQIVREQIEAQLAQYLAQSVEKPSEAKVEALSI